VTPTSTNVNAFLCPSDGIQIVRGIASSTTGADFGDNNYYNTLGTCLTFNGNLLDGPTYSMGTNFGPVVTTATIIDGTSNTAMFSESVKGNNVSSVNPTIVYLASIAFTTSPVSPAVPAGSTSLGTTLQKVGASCQTSNTLSLLTTKGYSWADQDVGAGGGYSHIMPPNKKACMFSNQNNSALNSYAESNATMISASSYHPGGVNVGFLDGSVKFIKDSVSLQTWGSISTKAGGEIVSADSF
jgi:prepilin-type processing-associated H-X9-DG protein